MSREGRGNLGNLAGRAGQGLRPGGEGVPDCGAAHGNTKLSHHRHERNGPERGAMYLARGPKIVGHEQQQKNVDEGAVEERSGCDHGEGRAASGCVQERDGGNQDQAFVGGWIEACAVGKEDQRRKHQHVADGNGVEGLGIEARTWRCESTGERIARGQNAEDDHETRQAETREAEAAMNIDPAGGDERGLRDQ